MNIPEKGNLHSNGDKDDQEDGEDDRLIVQDSNGFVCGADAREPVELTHDVDMKCRGRDKVSVGLLLSLVEARIMYTMNKTVVLQSRTDEKTIITCLK